MLNRLLLDTATPPIPHAQSWKAAYDGRRGPFIDMAQAVPGHPPPDQLLAALAAAAGSPAAAQYGPIFGDGALRAALAEEMARVYGAPFAAEEIAITAGCNMAFFVTMIALAKAGEAVILPSPWYFNHEMTLRMLGIEARPLPCQAERGFLPDPDEAAALLDDRVRALVLVTPNNPTGAVYPPELIARFAALAAERGITLVLDETYRDFLPDGAPHGVFSGPHRASAMQLYSFSKAYAVPGHRLGAIVAPRESIAEIGKILDSLQICPARPGQIALAPAIGALKDWRESNRAEIARRQSAFRAALSGSNGWRIDSIGAYFAFVAHPFAGRPAAEVAERLAAEAGVLALPGPYFGPGLETHLRFAFANVGVEAIGEVGKRLAG